MLEKSNLAFIIFTKHGFVTLRRRKGRRWVAASGGFRRSKIGLN